MPKWLSANYGFGFAKNHLFNDGNKRIPLALMNVFLILNGVQLIAQEIKAVCVIKDVANGEMGVADLATWFLDNSNEFDVDAE